MLNSRILHGLCCNFTTENFVQILKKFLVAVIVCDSSAVLAAAAIA